MASTLSSRNFLLIFWYVLAAFVVVPIIKRLIVISYRLAMQEKYTFPPVEEQLIVFNLLTSVQKLLNLMHVKTLKIIFQEIFLALTNLKLNNVNCKSVSVMIGTPFFYFSQNNLVSGLSSNCWWFDFDARVFIIFKKKEFGFFFS